MKAVKSIVIVACAMLLLGTFATAQYRDWGQRPYEGREGSPFLSALSDLHEAQNLLSRFNMQDPAVQQLRGQVNYAINELNGAAGSIGEDSHVAPAPPIRAGSRLDSIAALLDRAHQKLSYAQGGPSEASNHVSRADQQIQQALQTIQQMQDSGGRY